ncbi:Protein of unknown function DUF1769 [Penicillium capsulatum]|uniref:Domain of unknown function at the cortex 1 domain-containing protein n=1 Tax=Penicillium capsulatum TaxID=69766 RepID=A0A9W9LR30_9EURO|nr:Protein of unknown function DUF1769 [Penicillium capsulatum]KAJ6136319.1 Protein of unknown function DUF1769 [Penicillium capsulatum]
MVQHSSEPRFRLKVTAGPDYAAATHQIVQVNGDPLQFESSHAIIHLNVRIQDYEGYPDGSPSTSDYFQHPLHKKDKYSIAFSIIFKQPVKADRLLFGNDFDHPIRDKLPWGFNMALGVVRTVLDPSIDGDTHADHPYLYSPALATWNQFRIGDKNVGQDQLLSRRSVVEEGADSAADTRIRTEFHIPSDAAGRRKHFQNKTALSKFEFEAGRVYMADFGNQYLNFSDMSVTLPGINVPVHNLIDEDNHELRYVLKDKDGCVYLVVVFEAVLSASEEEARKKKSG